MTADVVPSELLEIPSPQERRRLDRDLCAGLLDRLLRRLARQEALCRRVLGHLARHFPAWRAAEAIAAEGLASDEADGVAQSDPAPAPRRDAATPLPAAVWDAIAEALPEPVERLTLLADTADPFQLDARLRAAVRALKRIVFQTGRQLRLVAQLLLHRAFGVTAVH